MLLDIGGGYPGRDGAGGDVGRFTGTRCNLGEGAGEEKDEDGNETAAGVAAVVMPALRELYPRGWGEEVEVIAEPGRYFVEAAFALCSRIYRVRVVDRGEGEGAGEQQPAAAGQHRHYYIAHGVQSVFKDCILCGESFTPIPYRVGGTNGKRGDDKEEEGLVRCTVHGPSGDESDVVCRDHLLPPLEVGDWLLFDRMGAYSLSISARSCKPPVRYVIGGQHIPDGGG